MATRVVLDSTDYLEYFSYNPEIKVIGMYLEGVRDGRRFLRVLREVSVQKPVVIWKGGERAIASPIDTGVKLLSKIRGELSQTGRKPALFIMTDVTGNADKVGRYLEQDMGFDKDKKVDLPQ